MKNYRNVMSDFLICYELGNWDNCKELVNDDIVLESTLAGTHRGIEELNQPCNCQRNIISVIWSLPI